MEENVKWGKMKGERRFYTIAPLLVLPFLAGFFYALGGGEGARHKVDLTGQNGGINATLPEVTAKDEDDLDKLAFYNQAAKDSLEYERSLKGDPYANQGNTEGFGGGRLPYGSTGLNYSSYNGGGYNVGQEDEVMSRLQQLQQSLRDPEPYHGTGSYGAKRSESTRSPSAHSGDIDRLEGLMTAMQSGESEDPEMNQLSGMLESILDIQHPERVNERLKEQSSAKQGEVFKVSPIKRNSIVSVLDGKSTSTDSSGVDGFFGISKEDEEQPVSNAINAVVHETQTVTNGSIVKLRLLNDVYVNGQLIQCDSYIHGVAQISGERLTIEIPGIRYGSAVFPVKLSVFDLDGLAGIYVPGAISREVTKESGDRTLQSLGLATFDQSLKAQAVTAGIEAGKTFLSRKVKLVKVTLKAGYKVLLVDDNKNK